MSLIPLKFAALTIPIAIEFYSAELTTSRVATLHGQVLLHCSEKATIAFQVSKLQLENEAVLCKSTN